MKIGDLVKWSDEGRAFLVGHTGIILKFERVSNHDGAWIFWFEDEYGPKKAWTPLHCIEGLNESR